MEGQFSTAYMYSQDNAPHHARGPPPLNAVHPPQHQSQQHQQQHQHHHQQHQHQQHQQHQQQSTAPPPLRLSQYNSISAHATPQPHHRQHQQQQQSQPQQQQQQHQQSQLRPSHEVPLPHTTLPPLQHTPANGGYHHYGSINYQHHAPTSHLAQAGPQQATAPSAASSSIGTNSAAAFVSHPSPATQSGAMLPPTSYNAQQYTLSQSALYPPPAASAPAPAPPPPSLPPQPTNAAGMPAPTSAVNLPTIQPRPPPALGGHMPVLPQLAGATAHIPGQQQQAYLQTEEPQPTHVVGSQGRRGILPSAPGRTDIPIHASGTSVKSLIPQKDADGKFPCPSCPKTYLHAKHLKRHLLRHTGDRPYMCPLCKDTFSRSDILKRHFHKCSIRRGNPTGATHLAHQRRNTSGSRLSISQQEGPIGLAALPEIAGNATLNNNNNSNSNSSPNGSGDISSTRSSRANTLSNANNNVSSRNGIAGLGIVAPPIQPGSESNANQEQAVAHPNMQVYGLPGARPPGAPHSAYSYSSGPGGSSSNNNNNNNNNSSNGGPVNVYGCENQSMPYINQQSSRFEDVRHSGSSNHPQSLGNGHTGAGAARNGHAMHWETMFTQSSQDGYISAQGGAGPNIVSHAVQNIKAEVDVKHDFGVHSGMSNDSFFGQLYSHPEAWNEYSNDGFTNWSSDDPLQSKVDNLITLCFAKGNSGSVGAEVVKDCLTLDMVKHLAEHYTSYHGHWPFLHMPTFKLIDAADVLVLAMLCIGAIYSPQLTNKQSRQMMEFVRPVVISNSYIYNQHAQGNYVGLGSASWHVEELLALVMFHAMFTWHGEPHHREQARNEFPTLCHLAKCMDLCYHAQPGHYAYSHLHCSQNSTNVAVDASGWDWRRWLEQEKRNRAMYLLFLTDVAMNMMFNVQPQFDPFKVRLMLPSDDAAWDAGTEQECAAALGLYGERQQGRNMTGTRRPKQPGMREALRTLMEPTATFQKCATNAYGKFILVHALIVSVISCQRAANQPDATFQGYSVAFGSSTPATPLSQNDWLEQRTTSGGAPLGGSGRATPTDGSEGNVQAAIQQERKRLQDALDKWKRTWDEDMDLQYPSHPQRQLRRFGFSRDGVHFYFFAIAFLRSTDPTNWTLPHDVHFMMNMDLLKRIKQFVIDDEKNKDLGSVADIDATYGDVDHRGPLTLDMKLLFRPFDSTTDTPIAGVQTHSL